MKTGVEWLVEQWPILETQLPPRLITQAKEMEETMFTEYAEFCVRCDRAGLPLVKFEDWIKELTFKSEEQ